MCRDARRDDQITEPLLLEHLSRILGAVKDSINYHVTNLVSPRQASFPTPKGNKQLTINIHLLPILLNTRLQNPLTNHTPRIRDEDVHLAEILDDLFDPLPHFVVIRDLDLIRFGPGAVLFGQLGTLRNCSIVGIIPECHIGASFRHRFSDRPADSVAGACNGDDFALHAELLQHIAWGIGHRPGLARRPGVLNSHGHFESSFQSRSHRKVMVVSFANRLCNITDTQTLARSRRTLQEMQGQKVQKGQICP